ncbi:hypothetical protein AB6A40_000381 [Gnathostoma spinigerum]|uniref:Mitochondrial inner membrane protease subunit 2 n=1 Tax=Gnathostoma spinigerum TaxID=75299 RepID=A0ABD6EB27_9BILA
MEPTLMGSDSRWWKRDIVWLSRLFGSPLVGRIYTFISPDEYDKRHIKRVTAKEGDFVRQRRTGRLFEIPRGYCWMESDNPKNAKDSHVYGPVNNGLITARATRIIWPPSRWRKL